MSRHDHDMSCCRCDEAPFREVFALVQRPAQLKTGSSSRACQHPQLRGSDASYGTSNAAGGCEVFRSHARNSEELLVAVRCLATAVPVLLHPPI